MVETVPVRLLTGGLTALTALVGLFIAYQAYRGLRRNESRAMGYLSVGLILLFGVTYAVSLLGQTLISMRVLTLAAQEVFRLLVRLLQLSGVSLIAYSMWIASNKSSV